MKFLVTGANGDIALSVLEILKRNFKNSIVHGTDINLNGKGKFFFDKIYKSPKANSKNFILYFNHLSKRYDLVIPTSEAEITFISKNIYKFKKDKILINSSKIINLFIDKLKTHKFLKKNNIGNLKFTDNICNWKKYKFPMFVKKKIGAGNKGYFVARSKKDIYKSIKKKNFIIQEYLSSSKEFTACIYSNGNKDSNILIFERVLDKDKTIFARLYNNKKVNKQLERILKVIDFSGSINIQFKIINKKIKIFEINPRLSSTVNMRDFIGFKDCIWWISNFLNLKKLNKKNKIKNNIKLLRYEKIKIIN